MKLKNVFLVVAAAVVFGGVAEAMEARPMPTLHLAMFKGGQQWFPLENFGGYRNFTYADDGTNSYVLAREGQTGNAGYAKLAWSQKQNKLCINAINTGDLWSPSASDNLTAATYDQIVNWFTPEEEQKERREIEMQVDSRSLPTGTGGSVVEAVAARPMPILTADMLEGGAQWFPLENFNGYRDFTYVRRGTHLFVKVCLYDSEGYATIQCPPGQGKFYIKPDPIWSTIPQGFDGAKAVPITYDEVENSFLPMQRSTTASPVSRSTAAPKAAALDYYRNTKTGKYYAITPTDPTESGYYIQNELMLTEQGQLLPSGHKRPLLITAFNKDYVKTSEGIALDGLRKQQLAHDRSVRRRNTLAAIAAVIAALTSWRAYKHRNLVVGAAERTPEMEALLASLAWYDRGSVKAARALQALWRWLPKKRPGDSNISALVRWIKKKETETPAVVK